MAITNRKERETLTEVARQKLIDLKTSGDFMGWYGEFFSQLGAKILGKLINNEHLRIEAAKKDLKRDVDRRVSEKMRGDRLPHGYSDEDWADRGHAQPGAQSQWKREKLTYPRQARKDIAEEERHADEVVFSESEGERGRVGDD